MAFQNKELLAETDKLYKDNAALKQQLREARHSIDAIKTENIDALVIAQEQALKVYTETSADKPYRILIENMHEGAVTLNEGGTILYCNSYFANMVTLPLQKVIGTLFYKFINDESKVSLESLRKNSADALKEEVYLYATDGREIPVLMTVNVISLHGVFVLNIILTDLTIQNRNQEKLKYRTNQLEQKNRELETANWELAFQNEEKEKRAAELIIANKELAFQNEEKEKRADELIIANKELAFQNEEKGKRADELIIANKELAFQNEEKGKRADELIIANKELAFQSKEKGKRAAELVIANIELVYQNREKDKRAAELVIANIELAFQNEEKEKRGAELILVESDVKDLEGLNTHKEIILATLSHDLRSPLAGIIQTTELLKDTFENLEHQDVKDMLDLLHSSAKDELKMLDHLVEWARIKYASEAFSPAHIKLDQYVLKAFDILHEIAIAHNIHMDNQVEENIYVFADGNMVISILQNIVSNSLKHTPAGGKIAVLAKRKEGKIIIEISDTGTGMSKAVIEKLFAPQMNLLSNVRKDNKGAGIGLLLVKAFLEKNGGDIWVESTEGKGSSFYFTLPAERPQALTHPG